MGIADKQIRASLDPVEHPPSSPTIRKIVDALDTEGLIITRFTASETGGRAKRCKLVVDPDWITGEEIGI